MYVECGYYRITLSDTIYVRPPNQQFNGAGRTHCKQINKLKPKKSNLYVSLDEQQNGIISTSYLKIIEKFILTLYLFLKYHNNYKLHISKCVRGESNQIKSDIYLMSLFQISFLSKLPISHILKTRSKANIRKNAYAFCILFNRVLFCLYSLSHILFCLYSCLNWMKRKCCIYRSNLLFRYLNCNELPPSRMHRKGASPPLDHRYIIHLSKSERECLKSVCSSVCSDDFARPQITYKMWPLVCLYVISDSAQTYWRTNGFEIIYSIREGIMT